MKELLKDIRTKSVYDGETDGGEEAEHRCQFGEETLLWQAALKIQALEGIFSWQTGRCTRAGLPGFFHLELNQTRPDQTRPEQTTIRPDRTRPDSKSTL